MLSLNMLLQELGYEVSEYDDGDLLYFAKEKELSKGSTAYVIKDGEFEEYKVIELLVRSEDKDTYDNTPEDVLTTGEDMFNADTSCEFVTDNDCYLVWLKYVRTIDQGDKKTQTFDDIYELIKAGKSFEMIVDKSFNVECYGNVAYMDGDFYEYISSLGAEVVEDDDRNYICIRTEKVDYFFPMTETPNRFDDELPNETMVMFQRV